MILLINAGVLMHRRVCNWNYLEIQPTFRFMKYPLVALDIGNTCVPQCYDRLLRTLGLTSLNAPALGVEPWGEPFHQFLLGNLTEEEYLEDFHRRFPQWPKELIYTAHVAYLGKPIPGMPELIQQMHSEGTHFVFFTDINTLHWKAFRAISGDAFACVRDRVGSDEVHAMKPSEEMFAAFEQRFGVPDLYLDDRLDLINVANEHGWHAVQARRDVVALRQEIGVF